MISVPNYEAQAVFLYADTDFTLFYTLYVDMRKDEPEVFPSRTDVGLGLWMFRPVTSLPGNSPQLPSLQHKLTTTRQEMGFRETRLPLMGSFIYLDNGELYKSRLAANTRLIFPLIPQLIIPPLIFSTAAHPNATPPH